MAPPTLICRLIEIGDIAMFNEDLESEKPATWARLQRDVAAADAFLFLTPEYNRSIPACLKNALDVASRPEGKNVWTGKPAAIVSVTPYKMGAFGANHALRQALVFLNVPAMQQPEAYIGDVGSLFDKAGKLTNKKTRVFLGKFLTAFENWISALGNAGKDGGFDGFMAQRAKIAAAYSSGDASLLDAIVAREGKATFFPPTGGSVSGAVKVARRYDSDAKAFSPGSETKLKVLQASQEIAFWTGFQEFDGKIGGHATKMKLRITEIFRRDGDGWKLIHRHADPASAPSKPK
jgi:NAD(P)H-dependent FMN reductase/ketosteroid isomerase-like protein